jgi:PhoPQ-activated pathogenicity-related protein
MISARAWGILAAFIGVSHVTATSASLAEFVAQSDQTFQYEVVSAYRCEGATIYSVRMTSQVWRGEPWRHALTVFAPDELQQRHTALLVIGGGVNEDDLPQRLDEMGRSVLKVAKATGSLAAMVEQVPNQPLFDGKVEDEIIAQTFDEYLEGGDENTLLLFPMVKSVVRAMDAVQDIARRHTGSEVAGFVLTGASKRGWTTYLTASVDPRVEAMAPMVIDMLNMPEQIRRQRQTYGGYSESISDYTELDLQSRIESEEGEALLDRVDPYRCRLALTMPKLVLLGTNDPFWTVDAASVYWPELPGPKWLHYEANTGHGLGDPSVQALAAFYAAMTTDVAMPQLTWERHGDELAASWEEQEGNAFLWSAWSVNRDFRQSDWSRQALGGQQKVLVKLQRPEEGWNAFYIEVRFPDGPMGRYGLTTEIFVRPATLPYAECE